LRIVEVVGVPKKTSHPGLFSITGLSREGECIRGSAGLINGVFSLLKGGLTGAQLILIRSDTIRFLSNECD
jgi:hypothetical protein